MESIDHPRTTAFFLILYFMADGVSLRNVLLELFQIVLVDFNTSSVFFLLLMFSGCLRGLIQY